MNSARIRFSMRAAAIGNTARELALRPAIGRLAGMSAPSDTAAFAASDMAPSHDDALARRNAYALFAAQAILSAQLVLHITFSPLAGAHLAQLSGMDPSWATSPITLSVLVSALSAAPLSLLMSRVGRRPVFLGGAFCGAVAGATAVWALYSGAFAWLLVSAVFTGVYQSAQGFFRFAAADTASPAFKPTAIGLVLGGGIVAAPLAGVIGANASDLLAPIPIAGIYLAVIGVNALGLIPLALISIPKPPRRAPGSARAGRSLSEIFGRGDARAALLAGMISYALMALVMTATSTAMIACGLGPADASAVISAHVVAMFAPSFFLGAIIGRIGHRATISLGLVCLAACGVVALTGVDLEQFYIALILLGVGWSFGFGGATAWLASLHTPEEQGRVQAFNDMCVFGLVAAASLASGFAIQNIGWSGVNLLMIPFLTVAALALAWRTAPEP